MDTYIGVKLVEAEQMTLGAYNEFKGWAIPENEDPNREGYLVKYSEDYISWCPKEVFEKHNLQIEKADSISQSDVDSFCSHYSCNKVGEKTTLVVFSMRNGFEITETSSCVDPNNYNEGKGLEICTARAQDKVWGYLGFLLQSARNGFDNFKRWEGISHPMG